jgi:hypothetical protein
MRRICVLGFCALLFFSARNAQAQDSGGPKVVGIMPVFDTSGETYGQLFSHNLTAMVYQKLDGAAFQVLLLNPGALYNPLIPESVTDYAQTAGVDKVLVMTLQPTDKPQKGDFVLHVEAKLIDMATTKEMAPSVYSVAMSRHDALLEAANLGMNADNPISGRMRQGAGLIRAMSDPNKPFAKQPLGKAANTMAESVRAQVVAQVPVAKGDAAVPPKAGSCTITIGVKYASKKAVSKAYDIIVNGKDESLWTKEGGTTLENTTSGPIFVQLSVADAPYRLPVQDLYQANTVLDCSQPERTLTLEIGAVGEALFHWR